VYARRVGIAAAPQPDEGATVAESPSARRRVEDPPLPVEVSRAVTLDTTAEVLRAEERGRAIAFSRALITLSGIGVSELKPGLPADIDRVLALALAKDVSAR